MTAQPVRRPARAAAHSVRRPVGGSVPGPLSRSDALATDLALAERYPRSPRAEEPNTAVPARRPRNLQGMGTQAQASLTAPVAALLSALEARDRDQVAAALSGNVRLQVPSLGIDRSGSAEVLDAVGAVLVAFPDFRYRIRNRYVARESVTDEAVFQGTRTGPLLGSPPNGHAGAVPARVLIEHDGRVVTTITVWADDGALRELVCLPGPPLSTAGPLVSRLRATLPTGTSRVVLARERVSGVPAPLPEDPAPQPAATPPRPTAIPGRGPRKVPVTRKVRRLQATALAALMVGTSSLLVTWMVNGTVHTASRQPPTRTVMTASPVPATPMTRSSSIPSTNDGSPVEIRFDPGRNEFELSTDALFFDTDSSRLTPAAQNAIARMATQIRAEHRFGRITVTGYTDQRGAARYNQALSRRRADAVARTLHRALGRMATKVSVVAIGKGEANLIVTTGTTAEELAANRRVTIQVPKSSSAPKRPRE